MYQQPVEVRGTLSLGTVIRLGVVIGLAVGTFAGFIYGFEHYLLRHSIVGFLVIVAVAPLLNALFLAIVSLLGYPMYLILSRKKLLGLDKFSYVTYSKDLKEDQLS